VDNLVEKANGYRSMFAGQEADVMARNNAFNFSRLSRYNYGHFTLEEAIYLEYLIYHHLRKIEIPVQASRVKEETGLLKFRQENALKRFIAMGFVSIEILKHHKKITLNATAVAQSPERIFLKTNKSILRFLDQLVAPPPAPKEKGKPKQLPLARPKKAAKSASGKTALPTNQIGLFD
jgi:hypothetical protein